MRLEDAFDDIPGRKAVRPYAKALGATTREAFVREHDHPFLIQMNEGKAADGHARTSAFATLVPESSKNARAGKPEGLWIFEVAKRPGANAFDLMVTLGRTHNNDIIVDELSVSKFHASLRRDPQGRWTITDMSTNGVRVDDVKLARDKPVPLRSGARLLLADAIELIFLAPGDAFDYLKRVEP